MEIMYNIFSFIFLVCGFYLVRCYISGTINNKYHKYALKCLEQNIFSTGYLEWNITRFILFDIHLWTTPQVIKSQKKRLGLS